MTALAPVLQGFFTDRLITQRNARPQTIAAYRDTFRLLLRFAHERTVKQPFQLDIDDLDAPLIGAFLNHLEQARDNSPRTRNARLGAIHSFYRFAALEHPEHAHTIARVMAIPTKRYESSIVSYLDIDEIKALLAAPNPGTWLGRRDHALLVVMIQTGVRVSELTGLRVGDVHLGTGAHIRVTGKGRKQRATTLTGETVNVVRAWLNERRGQPDEPLFPTRQGRPLSRYTVGVVVSKHAATATAAGCSSLKTKQITPHTLRHTNAMLLRSKGVDIATIALWLGHSSTQTTHIYEHADPHYFWGSSAHPVGPWVTQQARNLVATLEDQGRAARLLVRDRDGKFVGPFDEVMRTTGARAIKTPVRAPQANAFAQRFVRTARAECLDWVLVRSERHLDCVLREFVTHYNHERPHRGIDLQEPVPYLTVRQFEHGDRVVRADRLGGLLHEYRLAA